MESMGLTPEDVGKHEPSMTKRPLTAWHSLRSSTTDLAGSFPIRAEPIWWKVKYEV